MKPLLMLDYYHISTEKLLDGGKFEFNLIFLPFPILPWTWASAAEIVCLKELHAQVANAKLSEHFVLEKGTKHHQ